MSTAQTVGGARGPRLPRSARRAQLLAAAQTVFARAGYHSAGMDDIADRAGVSKPVLYQHFPGKLDLYLALLDQHCGTLESLVREALHTPAASARSRVFATIEAYFDFVSREDAAFRMVFESDLTGEPRVRDRLDAVTDACAAAIAEAIVEDTAGGLDQDQALLMGVALAGLSQVSARHWLAQGSTIAKDTAAHLVGQLAWRGVTGFPTGLSDLAPVRPGEESAGSAG